MDRKRKILVINLLDCIQEKKKQRKAGTRGNGREPRMFFTTLKTTHGGKGIFFSVNRKRRMLIITSRDCIQVKYREKQV